jgi:hypothetical protein
MVVGAGAAGWVVAGCIQLGMLEHAARLNPQAAIAMACFMTRTPADAAHDRVRVEVRRCRRTCGELRIGCADDGAASRQPAHAPGATSTRQFAPIKINEDLT